MRLFEDTAPKQRWTGTVLPAVYDGERSCSRCGWGVLVRLDPFTIDALFFDVGYGESVRRTVGVCLACGQASDVARESVRPPRRERCDVA